LKKKQPHGLYFSKLFQFQKYIVQDHHVNKNICWFSAERSGLEAKH